MGQHRRSDHAGTGATKTAVPLAHAVCGESGVEVSFLLSRIREEWLRTHNNTLAVARGLEKTGSVITNAALLFVIVTVAFTFTSLIVTKEMGVGMTIAVLVDASIIRSLLAPATMRLLGRRNWWLPGRPIPREQREASQ